MADFVGLTSALSDRPGADGASESASRSGPGPARRGAHLGRRRRLSLRPVGAARSAGLFGAVASTPTASRVVDSVDAERLGAIRAARAEARERAWAAGLCPVRSTGPLILDFDATLVEAHSDKIGAAPTYKGGYGFSPLACFLDATNEALAILLRPGNRAPHNADDHIEVLDLAWPSCPWTIGPRSRGRRRHVGAHRPAGASHKFVDALVERGIEFSIGFEMRKAVRLAILALPTKAWTEAITADCEIREGARGGRADATLICRFGRGHPGHRPTRRAPRRSPVQPL